MFSQKQIDLEQVINLQNFAMNGSSKSQKIVKLKDLNSECQVDLAVLMNLSNFAMNGSIKNHMMQESGNNINNDYPQNQKESNQQKQESGNNINKDYPQNGKDQNKQMQQPNNQINQNYHKIQIDQTECKQSSVNKINKNYPQDLHPQKQEIENKKNNNYLKGQKKYTQEPGNEQKHETENKIIKGYLQNQIVEVKQKQHPDNKNNNVKNQTFQYNLPQKEEFSLQGCTILSGMGNFDSSQIKNQQTQNILQAVDDQQLQCYLIKQNISQNKNLVLQTYHFPPTTQLLNDNFQISLQQKNKRPQCGQNQIQNIFYLNHIDYDNNINLILNTKKSAKISIKYSDLFQQNKAQQQQPYQLNEIDLNNFYDAYLHFAEQDLFQQWGNQQGNQNIQIMIGRIIINYSKPDQIKLETIAKTIMQLEFLSQRFEVIMSGSIQTIMLKRMNENLTLQQMDEIFHALKGQCRVYFKEVKNDFTPLDFCIVFDDKEREISQQCKSELKQSKLQNIFVCSNGVFNQKNIETNEQKKGLNLLQLLSQINNCKQFKLETFQQLSKMEIKQNLNEIFIDLKQANLIKQQLEISKFTKYSLSSKGTTIDIKGIIKFYCTNGTAKDIMKQKNRGGVSLYVFSVILDLSHLTNDQLMKNVLPFLNILIKFCQDAKIICNLVILNKDLIIVKDNFVIIWSDTEIEFLIQQFLSRNNLQMEFNLEALKKIIISLEKFNSYKKYVFLINHSLYNYGYQNYLTLANFIKSRQIKLISFGIGIYKHTNSSIQEISHFQLNKENNFYQVLKQVLDKKNILNQQIQKPSRFRLNFQQYSNNICTKKYEQQIQLFDCYLNQYFNYLKQVEKIRYQQINRFPNKAECCSFVFDQYNSRLFIGQGYNIDVYEFKNRQIESKLQTLTQHQDQIDCLIYLNVSNLLVSASSDKSIVIWNFDQNGNWKLNQLLEGHEDSILSLINNEEENLIISGSKDQKIKFWKKINMNWSCQQTILTYLNVVSLSLSKSQKKLIFCGYDLDKIIIME